MIHSEKNRWHFSKGDRLLAAFFEVAKTVYQNDPLWPVESPEAIRWSFSSDNPYAQQIDYAAWGEADQGRIAAFHNPMLIMEEQTTAFFGFFECIPDKNLARRLFDKVERWALERNIKHIYGPINFTTYGKHRIRTGFTPVIAPFPGEPYNPDYYGALLEACGYLPYQEYVSQFGNQYNFPAFGGQYERIQEELQAQGFRAVRLNAEFWLERQAQIYPVFQSIWKDNFGYIPIDFGTFCRFFGREATDKIDPYSSCAILDSTDELWVILRCIPTMVHC